MNNDIIQVMDTTLRDGEQTTGVSFTAMEKLSVAKVLLQDVKVDFIEVASARVSQGEFEGTSRIMQWASDHNCIERVEVLGFVDGETSIDWIADAGGKVLNLLCKGSYKHVTGQLRKTPEQHVENIKQSLKYAEKKGITVNIYLEDWSNGMRDSKDYVFFLLDNLQREKVQRFMLPDTLGVLSPDETFEFCKEVVDRYPTLHFDFHAHNDYDLAVSNVYQAIKAGVRCAHTTVNGLGERAGNAPLSSVIAIVRDQLKMKMNLNESHLNRVSHLVETYSGIRIPENKPLIGEYVFTQCSGVHADGDSKDNLYFNDLMPERFGRKRKYALGKTSGKANIKKNLEELGISLDEESLKKVTNEIIKLGDKKKTVSMDDLPYIVANIVRDESISYKIRIENYNISHAKSLKPNATVCLVVDDERYEASSSGDGQYDAFMNALKSIYLKLNKVFPQLIDYRVSIPPGGHTDALVEAIVTWRLNREFKTHGLNTDQTSAAIDATEKMLNIVEMNN